MTDMGDGYVTIEAWEKARGKYLSHAQERLQLQDGNEGDRAKWKLIKQPNDEYFIKAKNAEKNLYLHSRAFTNLYDKIDDYSYWTLVFD